MGMGLGIKTTTGTVKTNGPPTIKIIRKSTLKSQPKRKRAKGGPSG